MTENFKVFGVEEFKKIVRAERKKHIVTGYGYKTSDHTGYITYAVDRQGRKRKNDGENL